MNFKRSIDRRRSQVGVDITPLVDVVFNLLIFLLISTTFKNQEQAFSIVLPKGTQAGQVSQARRPTVFVTEDGKYVFYTPTSNPDIPDAGRTYTTLDGVSAAIERYMEQPDVERSIAIKGDAQTDYQAIIDVVNECRRRGVDRVYFPYKKAEQQPESEDSQ